MIRRLTMKVEKSAKMVLLMSLFFLCHLTIISTNHTTKKPPIFSHLLTLHYDGPGASNATKSSLTSSYGSCRNVEQNAERMLHYFGTFGIDLSSPKQDPFKAYFLRDYDLQPWVIEHRAILASYYDFGQYFDVVVYRSSWRLVAKRDYTVGNGLVVPKASALHYGLFRIAFPRREVCIDYFSSSPGVSVNNGFSRFQTFHFNLYSELWGSGQLTGILQNRPSRKSLNWVLTFPPEGIQN